MVKAVDLGGSLLFGQQYPTNFDQCGHPCTDRCGHYPGRWVVGARYRRWPGHCRNCCACGLSVQRFRYQLLDGHRRFARHFEVAQIDLDFSRVQNVLIINPFYFRPLGLVSLTIESAGSSDEEVVLAHCATTMPSAFARPLRSLGRLP